MIKDTSFIGGIQINKAVQGLNKIKNPGNKEYLALPHRIGSIYFPLLIRNFQSASITCKLKSCE
jgi:hypothetical protein